MNRRGSGHALFVTLIVLALVALAVGLLSSQYQFRSRLASQESRRIHLNALTDAAIAESLAKLSQSSSFAGVQQRELGGGSISSTVQALSGSRREILASAVYRGWSRTIRVVVEIDDDDVVVQSWAPLVPGGS